jgi:hypothetical protein
MEIEKPKVKTDDKNLNEDKELMILAYEVFEKSEAGKKLFKKLKDLYINNKYSALVFPANMQAVNQQFGSIEVYTGYRSGQNSIIFGIERLLEAYRHMDDKQPTKG